MLTFERVHPVSDRDRSRAEEIEFARELYAALLAEDPDAHIDPFEPNDRTVIDGQFDLQRVARRVLAASQKRLR